ncbi:hypothetical protein LTR86_010000 [Recurvomyces mirabilis]|nr:hypothetical protein LTR86_010000 [Recurvomyces mirabilis]
MRLLKTETLEFVEFTRPPPRYAILSHRWGKEEVSYAEFASNENRDRHGRTKIIRCCKIARERKYQYVWIDTCCIDKRSSAELSEAINSMWDWYSQATECIVYLSDVHWSSDSAHMLERFERSEWFRRGWTLQELLAPRIVIFYTSDWREIGGKRDVTILPVIVKATAIPESCLMAGMIIHTKCIAERLSWASKRRTTRPEDTAYSLLGLMGVNMPLLYGEGSRAFLRLQQELVRQVDDESIFAWRHISPPARLMSGILANDISLFATSAGVRTLRNDRAPIAITNKGLQIQSAATYVKHAEFADLYVFQLNCEYPMGLEAGTLQHARCSIAIRTDDNGQWCRVLTSRLGEHLELMFPEVEKQELPESTFFIRLSRWDNVYQPVLSLLNKARLAWRSKRAEARP